MQEVVVMKPEEVLQQLEKHEAECNLRYKRIEERLDDQKKTLEKLDLRMWGLAALIVGLAIAERFI
jgi:chaperonin cofactor prefoldin